MNDMTVKTKHGKIVLTAEVKLLKNSSNFFPEIENNIDYLRTHRN